MIVGIYKSLTKGICDFVVLIEESKKELKNSVISVVTAVGPVVSFPDFSFLRFLESK